jgi:hypothetical protein
MNQSPYFAAIQMSGRCWDARQGKTMGRSDPQSNPHLRIVIGDAGRDLGERIGNVAAFQNRAAFGTPIRKISR